VETDHGHRRRNWRAAPSAKRPTIFVSRESDGGQDGRFQGHPQRPPSPLPPDQDQRDWEEVRAHDGSIWKARSSTSCPCRARTRSGTRTFSRIRRLGLMREAWRRGSEPVRSSMQMMSSLLLRDSATNTG
jgi:hypothetical protein